MSNPQGTLTVRPAAARDAIAGRMLLPEAYAEGGVPELLVAASDLTPDIFGAAAFLTRPFGVDPPGFRVAVRVAEPYRRRGIGRALIDAAAAEAARWGTRSLRAWAPLEEGPAACFLRAVGFEAARRNLHFDGELRRLAHTLRPLATRLTAGGRMPADARIARLQDVPSEAVAALCAHHLLDVPTRFVGPICDWQPPVSEELSLVAIAGGEVRGALLGAIEGDCAEVRIRVVDPRSRGAWANLLMLAAAVEIALAAGASRARFHCADNVPDTIKLAARGGARIWKEESFYARRIASATTDLEAIDG